MGSVLIYVQHLLGEGHLRRAAVLAAAVGQRGVPVILASGGFPVSDLALGQASLVQLPPVRSRDARFQEFIDDSGRPIDDVWRWRRCTALLDVFTRVRPRVLVVEMFPFGRRKMSFEAVPLLESAHGLRPRPHVVCSVRDILTTRRKPERVAEAAAHVRRWFDTVLVHGDPRVMPFEESFPAAPEIADRLCYTGYVVAPAPARRGASGGHGEVIVSAGGGAMGEKLFRTALAARALTRLARNSWRLLAGKHMSRNVFEALKATAPEGVVVEPARADFRDLLANCAVSVSQGGYNTVMDLLATRARAVVVPFAELNESEQDARARRLEGLELLRRLDEKSLTPASLARAIDEVESGPRPSESGVDLNGAERSAELIAGWARRTIESAPEPRQ